MNTRTTKRWKSLDILLSMNSQRDVQEEYLRLRGQMLYVHEWKAIIYLATPVYVFLPLRIFENFRHFV